MRAKRVERTCRGCLAVLQRLAFKLAREPLRLFFDGRPKLSWRLPTTRAYRVSLASGCGHPRWLSGWPPNLIVQRW